MNIPYKDNPLLGPSGKSAFDAYMAQPKIQKRLVARHIQTAFDNQANGQAERAWWSFSLAQAKGLVLQ